MAHWYYTKNGEKIGPITTAALKAVAAQGVITRETILVNHTGRTIVAGDVNGLIFPDLPTPPPIQPPSPQTSSSVAPVIGNWFYYDAAGQKLGPVSFVDLKVFAENGFITAETVLEQENGQTTVAGTINGFTFAVSQQPSLPVPVIPPSVFPTTTPQTNEVPVSPYYAAGIQQRRQTQATQSENVAQQDFETALKKSKVPTLGIKLNRGNFERLKGFIENDESVLYVAPTNATITTTGTGKVERQIGVVALTSRRLLFLQTTGSGGLLPLELSEVNAVNTHGGGWLGGHVVIQTADQSIDILVSYKKEIIAEIKNLIDEAIENSYGISSHIQASHRASDRHSNTIAPTPTPVPPKPPAAFVGGCIGCGCLLPLLLVFASALGILPKPPERERPAAVQWHKGGTLHQATVREWKAATYENKLATAADWITDILAKEGKKPRSMDKLKEASDLYVRAVDIAVNDSTGAEQNDGIVLKAALVWVLIKDKIL